MTELPKAQADASRIIRPGDRLYDPIFDFLIMLSAVCYASALKVREPAAAFLTPNPVMHSLTRWGDLGFLFPLGGVLEHALANKKPTSIDIGIITTRALLDNPMPGIRDSYETDGLANTLGHVIAPIFLMFFERYNVWLTANVGEAINWPAPLNFSRVVRNSIAHGGIDIRNPASPPVTWRDLSYSHADKGKSIVGSDLKFPEVVQLMFESSDALDAAVVPVL
ncbi:hypothetical protein RAD15_41630 [Bradyrhizobium sp. 14AA]